MSVSVTGLAALRLALLAVSLVVLASGQPVGRRPRRVALAALAALAVLAHLEFVRIDPNTGRLHLHHWDVYHYFVGAKYFPELGYDGLYEATVVADRLDDPARFQPDAVVRDLRGRQRGIRRAAIAARAESVVERFDPERWRSFRHDVAFFRDAAPARWHASEIHRDHGYNGSPLTTLAIGALAAQPLLDTPDFLRAAIWIDLVLVFGLAALVGVWLGAEPALLFALLWATNPLDDYAYVGGSLLRYDYFGALALGLLLLQRDRQVAAGVCFAWAGALRVFPLAFVAALVARDVIRPGRRARLHRHRALYASVAVSGLALVALSSQVPTPDGDNPWISFGRRLALHLASPGPNEVGLRAVFAGRPRPGADAVPAAPEAGPRVDRRAEPGAAPETRRWLHGAALAALLAVSLVALRRGTARDPVAVGLTWMFCATLAAHYYYCVLSLVPLVDRRRATLVLLSGAFLLIGAVLWASPGSVPLEIRYALVSSLVWALLIGLLVRAARGGAGSGA